MPLKRVNYTSMSLGCDPEFFFKQNGEIIGSEKIIPKDGIYIGGNKIIIDGVQAELNPTPSSCRALLANDIKYSFQTLVDTLKKHKGITADFSRSIEISKENLLQLEEQSRRFGCAPSKTIYKNKASLNIKSVDPTEYRVRAAGGHIHIGVATTNPPMVKAIKEDYLRVVRMLDIICGNTFVLLDRDESNIERRKYYGRAGEFRLPKHGLEYRTLSNCWLTSAPLMSLAFGLARLAVELMCDPTHVEEYYTAFNSKIKPKKLKDAINNNDFDLAMENYKNIESLILEVTNYNRVSDRYPICTATVDDFNYFVDVIKEKGLTHWFPDDPIKHWTSIDDCHGHGFCTFSRNRIHPQLVNHRAELARAA